MLAVGAALPDVTLMDQDGMDVAVSELRRAVIFTYPRANTPGCTKQAHCFRNEYSEWQKQGYDVFGLSNDPPSVQMKWAEVRGGIRVLIEETVPALGQYEAEVRAQAPFPLIASHFVVDADGRLALSALGVKPSRSSPAALAFAQK
ncbi:thioredoxin peroxidase dot5 [Malassezia sp. CBS 17886]|nr:thioredoxin peroxidase dot5 [Malassezia sp. CBS 17886]